MTKTTRAASFRCSAWMMGLAAVSSVVILSTSGGCGSSKKDGQAGGGGGSGAAGRGGAIGTGGKGGASEIGKSSIGRPNLNLTVVFCPPIAFAEPCRRFADVTPPASAR